MCANGQKKLATVLLTLLRLQMVATLEEAWVEAAGVGLFGRVPDVSVTLF